MVRPVRCRVVSPFHDPPLGQHLEAVRVDVRDHLDGDMVTATVFEEAALEPASHHSFANCRDRARAPSATTTPPALSDAAAAMTVTAISRPNVRRSRTSYGPRSSTPRRKPWSAT